MNNILTSRLSLHGNRFTQQPAGFTPSWLSVFQGSATYCWQFLARPEEYRERARGSATVCRRNSINGMWGSVRVIGSSQESQNGSWGRAQR